jgi:transcriptional regulator with XRE-family HTH domain
MNRADRKLAAQAALAKLWQLGYKLDQVAAALGTDRRTVSRWAKGSLAPRQPVLWRLQEMGQPRELRDLVQRVATAPTLEDVEQLGPVWGELTWYQLNAIDRALTRTMPRPP